MFFGVSQWSDLFGLVSALSSFLLTVVLPITILDNCIVDFLVIGFEKKTNKREKENRNLTTFSKSFYLNKILTY